MSDTQLPRYFVFHQSSPGKPHINAGSVHAADPEMALQNGRDVFVRRPDCVSLWVAPAGSVTTLTAEELSGGALSLEANDEKPQTFLVFRKLDHKGSHEHAGEVEARGAEHAVARAREKFGPEEVLVWMVCPEAAVSRSTSDEVEALFGAAKDKKHRDQAYYRTVTLMRQLRSGEKLG